MSKTIRFELTCEEYKTLLWYLGIAGGALSCEEDNRTDFHNCLAFTRALREKGE